MTEDNLIYVVYGLFALTGVILAEAVFLLWSANSEKRSVINRRMVLQKKAVSQQDVLIQLRKERGIASMPSWLPSLASLAVLKTQSGVRMPLTRFLAITTMIALLIGFGGGAYLGAVLLGAPVALGLTLGLPVMVLKFLRKRRHKRFGLQLPEALELITRGLKAGHPVPVAVAMVGREMPDPIGSEFGLVSDEITYGSDMVTALTAMYERVGHEDLPLFIAAVGIQSTTGGNLREILEGLSGTIRSRGKMRRKIRAISTEGRMSAYILTAVPCLFAAAITLIMPDYYSEVSGEISTWYMVGGTIFWLLLGNAIMFKMASFKF
ncbi:MAG TPA: type II secretion system F family protein [Rhizobiaceae bacterium]|nr:type II secretion system F family protein [Rhizobiaceae bacterium]